MDINFRVIDVNNIEEFEVLANWYNDNEIKPFLLPNRYAKNLDDKTPEEIMSKAKSNRSKTMYLILDGDKPIGEASIDTNFPHLVKDKGETAWISIVIGDKSYWGKGVAQKAMEFLEEESKRFGLNRIELGVFGFNQRAKAFYKKLGFNEIKLNEMFTFHNGKWHVDIRMEKYL